MAGAAAGVASSSPSPSAAAAVVASRRTSMATTMATARSSAARRFRDQRSMRRKAGGSVRVSPSAANVEVAETTQAEAASATALSPFHLAIPVFDLEVSRKFYGQVLGCSEGRTSPGSWVDLNLWGHQVVLHRVPTTGSGAQKVHLNAVDGDAVPVPHFGVALSVPEFHALVDRIEKNNEMFMQNEEDNFFVKFEIPPHQRFVGKPGEQFTMFFYDPSGNALEFKAMTNPDYLFRKDGVYGSCKD